MALFDSRHLIAIAAGYIASFAVYSRLPGPYLPVDQQVALARPMVAFLLPTTAAAIYALLGRLWMRDPIRGRDPMGEATYKAIVFRIVLFLLAIHAMVLSALVGVPWGRSWAGRGVVVLFGLLLVGIGNLLPRTRPNVVIGIRTSRTLADRRLWMQTHRVGGYVAVGLGIVIALAGAFVPGPTIPVVVNTAGAIGLTVLIVHHRRHSHV